MIERRTLMALAGCAAAAQLHALPALALGERERHFIAEAARMQSQAVAAGDQAYGAVIVQAGAIVGYGPSRVILDRNPDAHAERVALWDAQRRLGTKDLAGAIMYSISRPCATCEHALALANLERMYFGPTGADAGRPKRHGS
jgi:tRNA(Arg) A34 adenosine deaminase TadA